MHVGLQGLDTIFIAMAGFTLSLSERATLILHSVVLLMHPAVGEPKDNAL